MNNDSIGRLEFPIELGFLKQTLALLSEGAEQLALKKKITCGMREDRISEELDREMRLVYDGSESDIVNWGLRPANTVTTEPSIVFLSGFLVQGGLVS